MAKLLLLLTMILGAQTVAAGILFFDDFESFSGAGLRAGGGNGTLNSNQWRISGLSTGDTAFGEQHDSGSSARGRSSGPVRSGGLYAFDIAGSTALGWQRTGTNLTPGSLFLRVLNHDPIAWHELWLNFELWYRNDQPRSSSVVLHAEAPSQAGLRLLDFTTPLTATINPGWQFETIHIPFGELVVTSGAALLLEWQLDDAGGQGSRDEIAIDNLRLSRLNPTTSVNDGVNTLLYCGFGLGLMLLRARKPLAAVTHVNNT